MQLNGHSYVHENLVLQISYIKFELNRKTTAFIGYGALISQTFYGFVYHKSLKVYQERFKVIHIILL